MDAKSQEDGKRRYTTPRWVQVWFLQRSRDNWKRKYMKLKADAKRLQNRVNDVTHSRENWRKRMQELEAQNAAEREQAAVKKKADRVMVRRLADPPMAGHGFGPELISLVLRLVLVAGVSLRGTSRVLATISEALGIALPVPCWSTGRLWLLRLGHAMLTRELAQADDWAWLIDHSVRQERLKEKLGWLETFAGDLAEWSQWQQVVDVAVTQVDKQGIYRGATDGMSRQLGQLDAQSQSAKQLAGELVAFVRTQECRTRPGERFPGSTEVLESCFGKFKQLEKQQSRGGFTQLLLGFGALLAKVTTASVRDAMQASRTADIRTWAKQTLGVTVFAQRRLAFSIATDTG